jgi:hypothetical protein|tara:strand:+ start:1159 stop:4260 length:3102 start_codon:yes stop_codon:yes gene_type:complete
MKNFGVTTTSGVTPAATQAISNFGVTATPAETTPTIDYTPGGARFTPFTGADFIATGADKDLDAAALEAQIQNDLRIIGLGEPDPNEFQPIDIDITKARDARTMEQYNEFLETEIMRIDQVVGETVGDNWQGSKTVGPMSFNVSDGLARRRTTGTFADRQAYFKKHHPDGKYSRIPTGGNKFAEVYSITDGGDVFAVDPTGLSDISNEIASFTGNVLNFTTAGSVAGTFLSPLVGTAAGATVGNLIDQAILDETSMTQEELIEKLSVKDAATIGLIDGLITKFLPVAGGKFRQAFTGEEGGSILAKKAAGEQALAAQEAAERLNLPLFGAAQLATENKLLQAAFTQTAGTSSIPGRLLNNQQRKLYEALKTKAASNFDSFTANELSTYTKLQQDDLAEQVYQVVANRFGGKLPEGMTLEAIEQNIRTSAGKLQVSHNELIDQAYKKAFNTAGADSVVFDLSPLKDIARSIQLGTQIRTVPRRTDKSGRAIDAKGKLIPTPTTRAQGELSGELKEITDALLNVINPNVEKLVVKDQGKKISFDSLSQLKALRDRASKLMNDQADSKSAKQIIDAIDDILENPTGGGTDFLKFYDEAKTLARLKSDTLNASNIASMFSRKSEVMPNELAEKFWTGQFTSRDWDYFTKMSKAAAGNRPDGKLAASQLVADVQDGFITWLYQNPALTQQRIRQITEADNDLFAKMVPDAGDRKALENIARQSSWLQSDGINAAMSRRMTVGERALTSINEMTEAEIINFVNRNGGLNGKTATDMRAAIFKQILDSNSTFDKQGLNIIQPAPLAQAFTDLTNFSQDYAKFKPLFQSATIKGDVPTYDKKASSYIKDLQDNQIYSSFLAGFQIDAGGQIQAASAVSGVARLELQAFRTILTNNIMASVFATPPSVSQLKKLYGGKPGLGRFWNKRRGNVFANILGQLGDGFSKDVETPKEEVERTGQPPEMGDEFAAVAAPPAPTQVVSAPPIAPTTPAPTQLASAPQIQPPPRASQGAGITNFSSLFPRDELGGAIANRRNQGIMGLA